MACAGSGAGPGGSLSNTCRIEVMRLESRWECFSMSDSCCDRAASWHLTTTQVLSGGLGWVHVMAGLFSQAWESNLVSGAVV